MLVQDKKPSEFVSFAELPSLQKKQAEQVTLKDLLKPMLTKKVSNDNLDDFGSALYNFNKFTFNPDRRTVD